MVGIVVYLGIFSTESLVRVQKNKSWQDFCDKP